MHYGDTTLTFLNNWYRADQRGNPYGYVSAVAVEEKSVIDYNPATPTACSQDGEEPRPPRVPLVAIYPEEGTLYSDNPLYVLDADWVDDDEAAGAERFIDFVGEPENQEQILRYGFRPGNPEVAHRRHRSTRPTASIPTSRRRSSRCPSPTVLVQLLDDWQDQRKPARVLLLIDVSGSMGELGRPGDGRHQARPGQAGGHHRPRRVQRRRRGGLWVFTTDLGDADDTPASTSS